MHSALQVAQKLLELAEQANMPLTPMKLIKLTYLCHGWMLGLYGRPLFSDPVEAWIYGPVIKSLYQQVRRYGSNPVQHLELNQFMHNDELNDDEIYVIEETFAKYSHFTGPALSRLTHQSGSPWSIAYKENEKNSIISNDLISDHFAKLAHPRAA